MTEHEFFSALQDLVAGKFTPQDWFAWWEANERLAKQALSPGEFVKLKPKGASHGDTFKLQLCVEQAKKILEKRGIAFAESAEQQHAFRDDAVRRSALVEFGAHAIGIAEDELAASLKQPYIEDLFARWQATKQQGSPRAWLRKILAEELRYAVERPRWRGLPQWPFDGKEPLVFLGQIEVPENAVTAAHACPGETVYVFARRAYEADGRTFRMHYEVVTQDDIDARNRAEA